MANQMITVLLTLFGSFIVCQANPDAKRLHEDLMMTYNRYLRPVGNDSDVLTLKLGLKLSQLIDVNLRYQIMTTIVWVEQEWTDYKLKWDPDEYGGITKIHVPADNIWLPDLLLYNNADGNYEVTIMTKPIVYNDGRVVWKPPAVYKSSCHIDVSYFPFDQQTCILKFGTWTWNGNYIDLRHVHQPTSANESTSLTASSNQIDIGIDLSEFLLNVEWDVMAVPATRKEKSYICCSGAFSDITFNVTLRRKTLFYTVNLIIPCIAMSMLSILVFYLPSDSNEKISLSISIVVSVDVFLLCLIEIIPPTSFKVPLLGQYLLFMLFLVTMSVVSTIYVLNISFRTPSTHRMSRLQRLLFLNLLPRMLLMRRPESEKNDEIKATKLRICDGNRRHSGHIDRRHSAHNRRSNHHSARQSRAQTMGHNIQNETVGLRMRNVGAGAHLSETIIDEPLPCHDNCAEPLSWLTVNRIDNNNNNNNNSNELSGGDEVRWHDQLSFESATSERHLGWFNKCRRIKEMHERINNQQQQQNLVSASPTLDCGCRPQNLSKDSALLRPSSSSMYYQTGRSLDRGDFALRSRSCEYRGVNPGSFTAVRPNVAPPPLLTTIRPQNSRQMSFGTNRVSLINQDTIDCDCNESDDEEIYLCDCHPEEANAYLSLDFVAKRMENRQNYNQLEEDWRYVATVIDRLLLWIFSTMCIVGTAFILLQAPVLYDNSEPIDVKLSKVGPKIRPNILKSVV